MSGILDALFGRIRNAGTDLALGYGLNFTSGLLARLNPSTRFVDVSVSDAYFAPANLAPEASALAVPFVVRKSYSAGAAGTADDVTVLASAPFDFRIVDVILKTSVEIAATSARLRSATGGGGVVLSSVLSTATLATARENGTVTKAVAEGGAVFLRRDDRGVAGEVILLCERT
jgi:hypothetical protein